jgi:hypothetical protein
MADAKATYESIISAGFADFGDAWNEKELVQYEVELDSHQARFNKLVPMRVQFFTSYSPAHNEKLEFEHTYNDAREWPSTTIWMMGHNARERIIVDEMGLPVLLAGRGWRYNVIPTRGHGRVNTGSP